MPGTSGAIGQRRCHVAIVHRGRRPSDPGLVLAGARVDADRVAGLHEDRHDDHQPGLGRRVLAGTRLGVAGEAGLGLGDDQLDGHRQFDADRLALVAGPIERHPVLEVVRGLTELPRGQHELVVRVAVHEVVVVAVAVEELDGALLHRRARPARPGLERALDRLAALDVAQRDAHLGRAAAHLDVVVVEDLPELAVELDGDALLEFAGADHVGGGSWKAVAGHGDAGSAVGVIRLRSYQTEG